MSNATPISTPIKAHRKSSILASALSFFFPGLGQIYCHQDNKGVFLIAIFLLGYWTTGGTSSFLLSPLLSIDAFMIARQWNQDQPILRWEFFPAWRWLNRLPPRIIVITLLAAVALITVLQIRFYAADVR
jgi:TM2 domain-containing membrane protein YozV